MPKTILVLTCSECKFKEWCWEESRDVEENDRDGRNGHKQTQGEPGPGWPLNGGLIIGNGYSKES